MGDRPHLLRLPVAADGVATGGDGAAAAAQRSLPSRLLAPFAGFPFADTPAAAPMLVIVHAPTLARQLAPLSSTSPQIDLVVYETPL